MAWHTSGRRGPKKVFKFRQTFYESFGFLKNDRPTSERFPEECGWSARRSLHDGSRWQAAAIPHPMGALSLARKSMPPHQSMPPANSPGNVSCKVASLQANTELLCKTYAGTLCACAASQLLVCVKCCKYYTDRMGAAVCVQAFARWALCGSWHARSASEQF